MIVIIDYGMGNIGSIRNMLNRLCTEAMITSDITLIQKADKLILPGVGAFDNGMKNINDRGFLPVLNNKVLKEKVPILGICLGMQLITNSSEEGSLKGLGWIDAKTIRFNFEHIKNHSLKIPHMGWNLVKVNNNSPLLTDLPEESRFYFVHSFYVKCKSNSNCILKTTHGIEFDSAIQHDNIYGTQFHPEKSHKFGMKIMENFIRI